MKRKLSILIIITLSIILGGCVLNNHEETDSKDTRKNEYEREYFVPIQEYTGEGYALRDSREENLEIAEKHREEVVEAVKQYFIDNFHVDVEVHNLVSAVDGVVAYVESIGEPSFHTSVIIPVDTKEEIVRTDLIWALEGKNEIAMETGLYALAYKEEFSNLDNYLEEVADRYPIAGTPLRAIQNVNDTGYTTPYYFVASGSDVLEEAYNYYLEQPELTGENIREFLTEKNFDPKFVNISIEFYMEESNTEPDQEILDAIVADIESLDNIPPGEYSVHLHDNFIDKRRGIGHKENSIKRGSPNKISKK